MARRLKELLALKDAPALGNRLDERFAAGRDKMDPQRFFAFQPLGNQGNVLRLEKLADELGIASSDVPCRVGESKDIGPAEDLGTQAPPVPAKLHDLVDQQFHGMHAVTRRDREIRDVEGKHEMIQAADAGLRIEQAGRHAGAKYRGDDRWLACGEELSGDDFTTRRV